MDNDPTLDLSNAALAVPCITTRCTLHIRAHTRVHIYAPTTTPTPFFTPTSGARAEGTASRYSFMQPVVVLVAPISTWAARTNSVFETNLGSFTAAGQCPVETRLLMPPRPNPIWANHQEHTHTHTHNTP